MNKKAGDEKYYILLSLIIGIMILGIVLFFIFKEYFTEDDLTWEACRQSIVMRASVPDTSIQTIADLVPLKCKTGIYNVNYEDKKKLWGEVVPKLISACDSLTGNGKYRIFPDKFWFDQTNSYCFPCVRIHFEENVKSYYGNSRDLIIFYHYTSTGVSGFSKLILPDGVEEGLKSFVGSEGIDSFVSMLDLDEFSKVLAEGCELEGIPA